MTRSPLNGLQVLVTRPLDQAEGLTLAISAAGGIPLSFPLLDIAPVAEAASLHAQLQRLNEFDLAIFISPNAVSYGMAAIAAAGASLPAQVATVGAGSARALRAAGVSQVIVPSERSDSEGLLAMPELAQMTGKRVMILRGDGGRELLADTLRARGATVEYATCYQRSKTRKTLEELLCLKPEVLTVTSSEALGHLREMLNQSLPPYRGKDRMGVMLMNDSVSTPVLAQPLQEGGDSLLALPMFIPHPRIAESATRLGWREVILSGAGDDGLLASLIAWRDTKGFL